MWSKSLISKIVWCAFNLSGHKQSMVKWSLYHGLRSFTKNVIIANARFGAENLIRNIWLNNWNLAAACPYFARHLFICSNQIMFGHDCLWSAVQYLLTGWLLYSWPLFPHLTPHPITPQKVPIYKEYHTVCPLVRIGTPPTLLSPASLPLPPEPEKRRAHSPAGEGLGESQFRRLEKKLSTLPTLWSFYSVS